MPEQKRSAPVQIELGGRLRTLSLDLNATIALQVLTGEDPGQVINKIIARGDEEDPPVGITDEARAAWLGAVAKGRARRNVERIKAIRLITRALLSSSSPELEDDPHSVNTVGSWITVEKMTELLPAISKLLESLGGRQEFDGQLAPYVPTPPAVVRRMIEMADLKDGDEVIDLGAGDGRLLFAAAENARVTAYGVEAHADRYEALAARCKQRGDSDRIFLQHCDIREAVLNGCNVVFLYLLSSSNAELKPKLLAECKPGTRIISHDFGMPDWVPDETAKVECEDRPHVVHMWRVPAR